MSALEWADTLSGSAGALAGIAATKLFDRHLDRQKRKNAEKEGVKIDADAAQVIANTAVALVAPLKAEIAELRVRVEIVEAENALKTTKIEAAARYIRELLDWIRIHIPDRQPPAPPKEVIGDIPAG